MTTVAIWSNMRHAGVEYNIVVDSVKVLFVC